VRGGIYDLFLCPSCEQARDEIEQLSSTTVRDINAATTNSESSRNKKATARKMNAITKPSCTKLVDEAKRAVHADVYRSTRSTASKQQSTTQADSSDNDCDSDGVDGASCPCCLMQVSGMPTVKGDVCLSYYHQKCTKMNARVFDKFMVNVNMTGWVCCDCKCSARTSFHRLESATAQLAEELAAIKTEMIDMRQENNSIKAASSSAATQQGHL
jgi:hypothetical protein